MLNLIKPVQTATSIYTENQLFSFPKVAENHGSDLGFVQMHLVAEPSKLTQC